MLFQFSFAHGFFGFSSCVLGLDACVVARKLCFGLEVCIFLKEGLLCY